MKQLVAFTNGNVLLFALCINDTNPEGNLFLSRENMHELSILVSLHCWMLYISNDLNMNVIYK